MELSYHKKQYKEQLIDTEGVVRAERELYNEFHSSWIRHISDKWDGWHRVVLERVCTHQCLPKFGGSGNEYTEWEEV